MFELPVISPEMSSFARRLLSSRFTASKLIFSVVRRVDTTGTANYNRDILYQRYEFGSFPGQSRLQGGGGAFGPGPEHVAVNANNDPRLRVSNLPVSVALGGTLYITEIFSRHRLITPLGRLGVAVPEQMYSIAYF